MRNLNEIFRKDVTYDNIQSHKKAGFHPLFRRYIFGKTAEVGQIDTPSCFRVKTLCFMPKSKKLMTELYPDATNFKIIRPLVFLFLEAKQIDTYNTDHNNLEL